MSLRWRVAATIAAAATLAAGVTNRFVLLPIFWDIEPSSLAVGVSAAAYVLAGVGPLLVFMWFGRRLLRAPATFQRSADGTAFVVPGSPVIPGIVACVLMMQVGNVVPYERVPDTDRIRLPEDTVFLAVGAGLTALLVVLALVVIWKPAPSLRLTSAGIAVRRPLRGRDIRWEDLVPGGPHPTGRWSMRLLYRDGTTKRYNLPMLWLRVDATFLASIVRHYAEHPEHRADIGTAAELERLESAFATWRAAPSPVPQPA